MKIIRTILLLWVGQASAFDCGDAFKISRVNSKGRIQDREYNQQFIVDSIIFHHKRCLPYLISMVDSKEKTSVEMCCKGAPTKGELARIYLANLFTLSDWRTPSIEGFSWGEIVAMSEKPGGKNQLKQIYERKRHGINFSRKENCFVFLPIKTDQ